MESANKAIALDEKDGFAHFAKARVYFEQVNGVQCLQEINRSIELLPWGGNEESYITRGTVLLWLQRPKEAVSNFGLVLKINPSSLNALWGLWRANADMSKWYISCLPAEEFVKFRPDHPQGYLSCGLSYAHIGERAKAQEFIAKVLRIIEDTYIDSCVGEAYAVMGNYELALNYYDKALAVDRIYYDALVLKSNLLSSCPEAKYRDGHKAKELAMKAISQAKGSKALPIWKPTIALAAAHAECGEFEDAVGMAKKSLEVVGPASGHKQEFEKMLHLFEKRQAFRMEPVPAARD